jgi:thiol-disulfide isomerase/thioredoxin
MKKKLILLLLVVALLPIKVFAKSFVDDYNTMNFKETIESEGFTLENKDYKETDDQAIIYMFRGQGCGYCRAFLEFMNSISKEYGKYFKMVSFEVWNDANNADLLEKVPLVTNKAAGGVPYIIIGEKVFAGYAESYNDGIKAAIMAQYEDSSYDVMEELDKTLNGKSSSGSSFATIFWNAFFVVAATVAIIIVNNNNTKRVLEAVGKKEVKEKKDKNDTKKK